MLAMQYCHDVVPATLPISTAAHVNPFLRTKEGWQHECGVGQHLARHAVTVHGAHQG
jgi:hypothetical protein